MASMGEEVQKALSDFVCIHAGNLGIGAFSGARNGGARSFGDSPNYNDGSAGPSTDRGQAVGDEGEAARRVGVRVDDQSSSPPSSGSSASEAGRPWRPRAAVSRDWISSAMSWFSERNSFAFSFPCPIRRSP